MSVITYSPELTSDLAQLDQARRTQQPVALTADQAEALLEYQEALLLACDLLAQSSRPLAQPIHTAHTGELSLN
jgi:hypothetical protein